ncbi:MAG: DUF11 domain-containing protein [Sedimentisphaerales bacterium]|nr:DUF11 domain-containing protein [Sedimentisphaerales bacterium]
MMKKILTISLFLLVFSSSGCSTIKNFLKLKKDEPEIKQPEKFFWDSSQEPIAIPPIPGVPTSSSLPVQAQVPVTSDAQRLVGLGESDMAVISMTYPWPECGLVRLDKSVPREVALNRSFDYYIAVTNLTETMLTNIVVNEELSRGFEFTRSNPAVRKDLDRLVWEIKSLGPKASKRITISGVATSNESLEHCTTVVTPTIPACAPIRIVQPRLELARVVPEEALLCEAIPVVFVVTNSGTGTAQNVSIVDTLPVGLRTTDGQSKLVLDVGSLGEGQSRQFSVELRAAKVGRYAGKAIATSTSGLRAESAETTTIVSLPVLAIENKGPQKQYLGRKATYEIMVANRSDIPAKNTIIEETLPNGATSVEANEGAKLSGSKLIWELGTLAPNSIRNVRVSYIPTEAGMQTNTATATAYCSEAVTASVQTLVSGISALALEVVDVEDPIRVDSQTTYVISVLNQGSATATNIRITCLLEGNVQYLSSAGATAGSVEGQMVRFFPLSNLEPQARAAWRVIVAAVKPGDVRFKAVMNADQLTRPVEENESTHIYE